MMTTVLGTVVGVCLCAATMPMAMAQESPPSLSDAVKASLAAATAVPKTKKEKAAEEKAAEEPVDGGINLPVTNGDLLADQLEMERQAQEAAERAAEEEAQRELEHNRKSYKKASQGLLPLSPDQVRDFMNRLETTQEAALPPHAGTPKGEVKVVNLSLDPGVQPPQINLAAGYVTTIDIIDQTGEPWPILDVGIGGNFEVTPTQAGSHVVRVVPLNRYGTGNLSVLLKGLSTPVIFKLSAGGQKYHMRFDARIPKLGPNAKAPLIEHRRPWPIAGDKIIMMFLENAPPADAKRLSVGGVDARTMAWQLNDRVYVRTPLSLLSPAWNASASSADGMTVYEIGDAPVLLMSDNGAMVRARLMREDTHDK
ncbi:MAG: DotH/IcmK family type IV secretion protein [Alphaproteobacteria bacterium]|jgi:intracellular multiplication protein IcmK|nr:DotH/IcmK family type IV secretion protein [Alphaproteobacteria bacterium]